ncbi:hypothetical protein D3C79_660100 [compost metagenome]
MLTHLVAEAKVPLGHGIGPKCCSESLADRAYLEQGLLIDPRARFPIGQAVVEVVSLPVLEQGDRHPRDPILRHHRLDGLVHQLAQRRRLGGGLSQARPQQRGHRQPVHALSLLHRFILLSVWIAALAAKK